MRPEHRFDRALGVPDGIVSPRARTLHIARRLVERSTYAEDNRELAHDTAAACVDYLREKYGNGDLDFVLLGDETVRAETIRIVAELENGYLRGRLSHAGAIVQPMRRVPDAVVEKALTMLREFVEANPVDCD